MDGKRRDGSTRADDAPSRLSEWDKAHANALARSAGIGELTGPHWRVVDALRALFDEFGVAPSMVQLHERTGLDAKAIDQLFGNPYVAWCIAGLPHPGEEAEAYLRNQ